MYYGANETNEYKYRTYFEKLEYSIVNELNADVGVKHTITNNYKTKKVPTLTIESVIKLRDRDLNVKTELDVNFPKKAAPRVFCTDSVRSPAIKADTGEIVYNSFYAWDGNTSKINILLKTIQSYFNTNPPQQSQELELVRKVLSNTRDLLNQKIRNFNIEKFKATLSAEEAQALNNADKNYEILMKSDEIKEVKKYVSSILYKTLQNIGEMSRRNWYKRSDDKFDTQQEPGRHREVPQVQRRTCDIASRL